MSANLDELYPYYRAELDYLRRMGGAFAERYPKVAARLEMSSEESPDPQVERLLESFAFLTARLQHRLDGQFPEVSTALLSVVEPHLVAPIPPMAIAQFEPDPSQGKLQTGFPIARHTRLFAQTADGLTCRFRTCYPVELWPVEVVEARLEPKHAFDILQHRPQAAGVLRLRLRARGVAFRDLALRRLRFHLHGEGARIEALYDLMFSAVESVAVRAGEGAPVAWLPASALRPVGFGADEDVVPYPVHAHPATRLLQEYFFFPEKFLFFDIDGLTATGDETMEILVVLSRLPPARLEVQAGNFMLGATPIVNLFPRTTEPIRVDQRATEYRLVADMRRERTTEIHTIVSVSGSSNPAEGEQELEPLFGMRHRAGGREPRCFWQARRLPTGRADMPGTELRISFVDMDLNPAEPVRQMVYAHTLCTNRDLADQVPAGARLQTEEKAPLQRIRCLGKPTGSGYPRLGGASLWSLISSLSLNYLSLSGAEGLDAFQSMLRLYGGDDNAAGRQLIEDIREMRSRPVTRRLGGEAWRGFCPGIEVTLVLEDRAFRTHGLYLFGAVVQHFLGLHAAVNSFAELVLRPTDPAAPPLRFKPRAGAQALL